MATGRPTSAEAYFAPLGTWFDVRTYAWAGGLMVHFRDIGARKAAEAERERLLADAQAARREAEAANRAKSDFLAVMSHELRTPLNAIAGYAELMEMGIYGAVTPGQRTALDRIQRSQRALLSLINEVLNYARLESGAVTFELRAVRVAEAIAGAAPLVAPQLRAKGLVYRWDGCDPDLAVRADPDKLQQVLLNLLSNAVKFTNARPGLAGSVEVSCGAPDDGAAHALAIRVRDTGVGIAAEKLGTIFEPFVQVETGLTRSQAGTGLGLAISRDLARGMGGDLTVESTPRVGSTFTLTLPRA
jgi:signal transduction histidine kinase